MFISLELEHLIYGDLINPFLSKPIYFSIQIILDLIIAYLIAGKIGESIIEKNKAGEEASYAAAGMLAAQSEFDFYEDFMDFCIKSRDMYENYCKDVENASGINVEFQKCGIIKPALNEKDGIWTHGLLRDRQASTPLLREDVMLSVTQVGVEPTASLVLSQGGLPIAYRAVWVVISAQNRSRTCKHSGLSRAALPVGVSGHVERKWSRMELNHRFLDVNQA